MEKGKSTSKKSSNQVKIRCDICEYTSVSAEDFIKHIVGEPSINRMQIVIKKRQVINVIDVITRGQ